MKVINLRSLLLFLALVTLGGCGGGGGGGGSAAPPASTTGVWDSSTWDSTATWDT